MYKTVASISVTTTEVTIEAPDPEETELVAVELLKRGVAVFEEPVRAVTKEVRFKELLLIEL